MAMDCVSDAVSRFLQSPSYLQPLLEFIDQHCITFDDKQGNKLEYRVIHENFKQLVDGLISDYLASLDVPVHEFVQNLARHINEEPYDTLLKSILVVDDFLLFKDTMLKRRSQLHEDSLCEPMDLELLEGFNISQASDLDEIINLCYRTLEQQVQDKDAADLHRAPFMFRLPEEEKDVSKTQEEPIETEHIKAAAFWKSPAVEAASPASKNGIMAETSSVKGKPQNVSLLVPPKANLKELLEHSEHNQQGAPVAKRRDDVARDHMFSQKKGREKQPRMTDDSEYRRSNPYLRQYLKRESLAKPSVTQDNEAVRRRETVMKELALKLKDELVTREVKPDERNSHACETYRL